MGTATAPVARTVVAIRSDLAESVASNSSS
jgi:hypothetical protein